MRLGDDSITDIEVIPTGNILIDRALGVGGFPRGRVVEVFGPESSGKTTLTLTVIAQAQKRGGLAAFIDVEHALDPQYARKLGVNLDDLLVSQPNSGEEALRIVETFVPTRLTSSSSTPSLHLSRNRNSKARSVILPSARKRDS
jgi:recombination protein RecA